MINSFKKINGNRKHCKKVEYFYLHENIKHTVVTREITQNLKFIYFNILYFFFAFFVTLLINVRDVILKAYISLIWLPKATTHLN